MNSSCVIVLHIFRGSVVVAGPPTKSATTTSSKDTIAAKSAPASTPRRTRGSVTRRSACHAVAPRLRAARSSRGSSPRAAASTLSTT